MAKATKAKRMGGVRCPKGHTRVWSVGLVPTRTGLKRRYKCAVCGRSFYAPKQAAPERVRKPRVVKAKAEKKAE